MPLFCRHNRFEASCPICSRSAKPAAAPRARTASKRAPAGQRRATGVVTKRLARAGDDGYRNELVPGIKATADAERLAAAISLAVERLEMRTPVDVAFAAESAFGDPAALDGWTPPVESGDWTPERRFARWFDRLRLPGTSRAQRFAFLVALGPSHDLEADALHFDVKGDDATTLAAKRALNSGDAMLLERRAAALAEAAQVPIAALDFALAAWESGDELPAAPDGPIRRALRLP